MSFIEQLEDLFNKGKEYVQGLANEQIAQIKDYIGRYNTFENKIYSIQKQLNRGSYSNDILLMFQKIQERQKVLDESVERFMKMTDTVADDFSNPQISIDYLKSKFSKIQDVAFVIWEYFTSTKSLIDEQERDINDIQKLMAGSNPTILNIKNFIIDHWFVSTLAGFIIVKKLLK